MKAPGPDSVKYRLCHLLVLGTNNSALRFVSWPSPIFLFSFISSEGNVDVERDFSLTYPMYHSRAQTRYFSVLTIWYCRLPSLIID